MQLTESKSLLAKLMATENLTVEHRNVQTASFDVKNRILTLPVLDKNISGHLYDLFAGHEVGHALWTPLDGMQRAREEKLSMSIMNVLEDSRIERKIKNKYPGIRISFVKGYRELLEKDFFGTKDVDLNTLNFIDRVNLYTKGGPAQSIRFDEFEKSLVDEIENTQTYDDVIELARKIMSYMKQEAELIKSKKIMLDDEGDEEFDDTGYEESDEYDDEEEIESRSQSGKGEEQPDDMDELDKETERKEGSGIQGSDKGNSDELKSHTDEAYQENQSKLFEQSNINYYYGNVPDVDLDKAIITYKTLWNNYKDDISKGYHRESNGIDTKAFLKLRNDGKKVVGYLAKEFELRKNADQLKRASISKTGELNMSKIYAYQLTDDIFKKVTVMPNGKSHGLVMFLDWSGSMHGHMENTTKQLINLTMFCKKVNIPYEVYAFSTEYNRDEGCYQPEFKEGDLALSPFKLLNVISSKMSASEYTYACSALMYMCRSNYRPTWFSMGGTPLCETTVCAMKIIPQFQKQYKLQVVNTVYLTDGEGHPVRSVYYTDANGRKNTGYNNPDLDYSGYGKIKKVVIRDPKTKQQEICEPYGSQVNMAFIKLLKARTNCNIVGFYVLSSRELGRALNIYYPRTVNFDKQKYEFRKNKSLTVTCAGYDEYYLLKSEGLDTDEDVEFVVKENATTRGLVSAFSKYAGNRLASRVVLNRFIGMIA